ncbi:unnamed protein product, partial [Porites evermanni]
MYRRQVHLRYNMACCDVCDKIMECFTNGYQALTNLESNENLSYEGIKEDLDNISSDWEDLEKETLSTLKETMECFTQFTENEPKESEVETILTITKLLEEKFRTLLTSQLSKVLFQIKVPSQQKFSLSEILRDNKKQHGRRAWILSILLGLILGGVIAWMAWNSQILPAVFGVLIGGGALLIIGGLVYFIFAAVAERRVRKWKQLQQGVSHLQDTAKFILRKAQE